MREIPTDGVRSNGFFHEKKYTWLAILLRKEIPPKKYDVIYSLTTATKAYDKFHPKTLF